VTFDAAIGRSSYLPTDEIASTGIATVEEPSLIVTGAGGTSGALSGSGESSTPVPGSILESSVWDLTLDFSF
jgi:hypothetical protein